MRVVVVGATGNVGTSVVRALEADESVTSIAGVARRLPGLKSGRTVWHRADVVTSDLSQIFDGADAVIHLAWLFQPTRNPVTTWRGNVIGSTRVFEAVAGARVSVLIYASSVGAYSSGPKDRPVNEDWPTHGWPGPPTAGRRPTSSGCSTCSSGTTRPPGWSGCGRASSSSGRRRPSSGGCSEGRWCPSG